MKIPNNIKEKIITNRDETKKYLDKRRRSILLSISESDAINIASNAVIIIQQQAILDIENRLAELVFEDVTVGQLVVHVTNIIKRLTDEIVSAWGETYSIPMKNAAIREIMMGKDTAKTDLENLLRDLKKLENS